MVKILPEENYYRFIVDSEGIYAAVDRDCPRGDERREGKPDGSWLNKAGKDYKGAHSYWSTMGLIKYAQSGLMSWHESVVEGVVTIQVCRGPKKLKYIDELQIIIEPNSIEVCEEISYEEFVKRIDVNESMIGKIKLATRSIYETLGKPLESDGAQNTAIMNFVDPNGDIEIEKGIRNGFAASRLFFAQNRLVDSIFHYQVVKGEIDFISENSPVQMPFLHSNALLSLPNSIVICVDAIKNFLAYFYDLEYLDEEITDLNFLNSIHIEDPGAYDIVESILSDENYSFLTDVKDSAAKGFLSMGKLDRSKKTDSTVSITNEKSIAQSKEAIEYAIKWLVIHLVFRFEQLDRYMNEKYAETRGYARNTNLKMTKGEAGELKGSSNNPSESTSRRRLYKLFNLQTKSLTKMEVGNDVLVVSPEYDQISRNFYRTSATESRTLDLRKGAPAKIQSEIIPETEGDMLWTHTVIVENYQPSSSQDFDEQIELVALLLSCFTGKPVFTEASRFHNSHKGSLPASIGTHQIETALTQVIENFENWEPKYKLVARGLLASYRNAIQHTVIDVQLVELWSILDKIADFHLGKRNEELNQETLKKLENACEAIAREIDIDKDSILRSYKYSYSLRRKMKEMLFDVYRLDQKYDIPKKELRKATDVVSAFRGQFSHSSEYLWSDDEQEDLAYYYLFLAQLCLLLLINFLEIDVDTSQIVNQIKGFIRDSDYFKKLNITMKENDEHFGELLDYIAGKRKDPPSGGTTFTF